MLSIYRLAVSEEFYVLHTRPCWVIKPLTRHLTGHSRTICLWQTTALLGAFAEWRIHWWLWLLGKGVSSGPNALGVEAQRDGALLLILSLYLSYIIRSFFVGQGQDCGFVFKVSYPMGKKYGKPLKNKRWLSQYFCK